MGIFSNVAEATVQGTKNINPLQFALDVQRADLAMFESLIELDFSGAYNEAGIISLTEADKEAGKKVTLEGIKTKIEELVTKAIEAIKSIASKILLKIQELVTSGAQLAKKYDGKITVDALKDKDTEIKLYTTDLEKGMDIVTDGANLTNSVDDIDKLNSADEIDDFVKEFDQKINDLSAKIANAVADLPITKKASEIDGTQIQYIFDTVSAGTKQIKYVKDGENASIKSFKELKNKAKAGMKDSTDELAAKKAYAKYQIYSKLVTFETKSKNLTFNEIFKQVAMNRKALVQLGYLVAGAKDEEKKAEKAKTQEAKTEAAALIESTLYILGECSDLYAESL